MKKIFLPLVIFFLAVSCSKGGLNATENTSHVDWARNANIYEVNVRQYTPEGTFKAFQAHLPRLRKMGVDILWLMPIYPIGEKERKGTLGSYYAVKDYRAVNPEFGTMADLKALVNDAHAQGFKVILDWVPNHSAPDNALTTLHPDWYKHDSTGKIIPPVADWTDVSAFDYSNKDLRAYQIESMKFWLREADVDGFRCDVAMMVPLDFWKTVRPELEKVKKVFMLAEAEGPEFHANGFDMTYGWDFHHLLNQIAKGEKSAADIKKYFAHVDSIYQKDDYIMNFTSNHDENSWNGSEYERMGDAAKAMAVLCATVPGMPLVYSGQEAELSKRLKFFDKDPIDWNGFPLNEFYTSLLALKKQNQALLNGAAGNNVEWLASNKVLAFTRTSGKAKVLVILNLTPKPQNEGITATSVSGNWKELFSGKISSSNEFASLSLQPWEYRVYVLQ